MNVKLMLSGVLAAKLYRIARSVWIMRAIINHFATKKT